MNNQPVGMAVVNTDPNGGTPALSWKAKVTLTGPGPAGTTGIDHIQVGFHQTVEYEKDVLL